MLNALNLRAYLGMQAGSAVKLARTRRQSLALRELLWAGAGGAACSALAGFVIMLFRPPLAREGAASVFWSATVSAVAGVAGITLTHSVGSAAAFAPPQKPTHGSLNGHADASPPGRGRCGRDAPLVLAQSHADWTREKMPKNRVDFIFPREAKIRGGPGVTGGAELPSREVVCAEAVAWMEGQDELPGSLFTSMPDISEVEMRPAEYKKWFTRAAALAMRKLPPRSYALFYQTDVKARASCSLPCARAGPARGPPAQGRRGAESHASACARAGRRWSARARRRARGARSSSGSTRATSARRWRPQQRRAGGRGGADGARAQAAEAEGFTLLWRKVVCKGAPAAVNIAHPSYTHLLCFTNAPEGYRRAPRAAPHAAGRAAQRRARARVCGCGRGVTGPAQVRCDTVLDPRRLPARAHGLAARHGRQRGPARPAQSTFDSVASTRRPALLSFQPAPCSLRARRRGSCPGGCRR